MSSSQRGGAGRWDWKYWLPQRTDGELALREGHPPWQWMALPQTFQDLPNSLFHCSWPAWSWGGSCGPIPCLWLMMSLHHSVAPALGYCTATRAESRVAHLLLRMAAKGSNLTVGRTVFCRWCLPVPGAQGFPPAAIFCIMVTLPGSPFQSFLITAFPLHKVLC